MNRFLSNFTANVADVIKQIRLMRFADMIDVLIVAAVIYLLIRFIRRTNSQKVANGLLLLVVALWLANVMNLMLTSFLLRQVFEIGILAVIVLFQPEIRRALEKVGSSQLFNLLGKDWGGQAIDHVIMQTVYACEDMAHSRTGALIVFERDNRLNEPLTGRKWEYKIYPLSFREMVDEHGFISERNLLSHRLVYGYYPEVVTSPGDEQRVLRTLTDSYLYKDVLTFGGIKKHDKLTILLRALAYQTGSQVSYSECATA